ncbi:MAG: MGMT family protein [Elusimicrobiota bacterium]
MSGRQALPARVLERMRAYPPFYRKVWMACARIPRGQVRTYGWIARRIGNPGAARAVGRALAKNPFAPHVPCHRVVGADGRLTGFSAPGGIEAKRRLLEKEGALQPRPRPAKSESGEFRRNSPDS